MAAAVHAPPRERSWALPTSLSRLLQDVRLSSALTTFMPPSSPSSTPTPPTHPNFASATPNTAPLTLHFHHRTSSRINSSSIELLRPSSQDPILSPNLSSPSVPQRSIPLLLLHLSPTITHKSLPSTRLRAINLARRRRAIPPSGAAPGGELFRESMLISISRPRHLAFQDRSSSSSPFAIISRPSARAPRSRRLPTDSFKRF